MRLSNLFITAAILLFAQTARAQFKGKIALKSEPWQQIFYQCPVDYDLDGDLDIFQILQGSDGMYNYQIHFNDGTGHFAESLPILGFDEIGFYNTSVLQSLTDIQMINDGDNGNVMVARFGQNLIHSSDPPEIYYYTSFFPLIWGQHSDGSYSHYQINADPPDFRLESEPGYQYLYDFDGDNDLDVALIEVATGDKKWLLNEGNLFNFSWDYDVFEGGLVDRDEEVYKGTIDMNGDGMADMVDLNQTQDQLVWRERLSATTFGPEQLLLTLPEVSVELKWFLKDMTGDGLEDFVAGSADVEVYFALRTDYTTFDSVQSWDNSFLAFPPNQNRAPTVVPSDFDQDGDLDIMVTKFVYDVNSEWYYYDDVKVLMNNGDGMFSNPIDVEMSHYLNNAIYADFNGDGALDLCNAMDIRAIGSAFVIQSDIESNFFGPVDAYGEFVPASDASVFDLNLDGMMDLVCESTTSYTAYPNMAILNAFSETPGPFVKLEDNLVGLTRVDLDPQVENECYHLRNYYFTGLQYGIALTYGTVSANGEFVELDSSRFSLYGAIAEPLDLNNDGQVEILTRSVEYYLDGSVYQYSGNSKMNVLSANNGQLISQEFIIEAPFSSLSDPLDLDNDGFMELYYIDPVNFSTMMIECNADMEWSTPQVFSETSMGVMGAITDQLNGDRYIWAREGNLSYDDDVLFGKIDGLGQLENIQTFERNIYWSFVYIEDIDIDNDGHEDGLVQTDYNSPSITFISIENGFPIVNELQFPGGMGTENYTYNTSRNFYKGDVNGDGKIDVSHSGHHSSYAWINIHGSGCGDPLACNYEADVDHLASLCCYGTCGCTDESAINYNAEATCDNGSCQIGVTGRVFHDVIANGIFDEGDYGLAYQTVTTSDGSTTYITDNNGYFTAITGSQNVLLTHVADENFPYYTQGYRIRI